MLLGEDKDVVDYFAERRRLLEAAKSSSHLEPIFTFGAPHSCSYCSDILIDGEICNQEWLSHKAQTEQVMSGAVSKTAISALSTRLNSSLRELIAGSRNGCTWFEYLGDFLIRGESEEGQPFTGAEGHDVVFCLTPKSNQAGRAEWFNSEGFVIDEHGQVSHSFFVTNLNIWADDGGHASSYITNRPIEVDKTSDKSSKFARTRLETCLREHRQCRQSIQPDDQDLSTEVLDGSDLPSRLLSILKRPTGLHVRLIEVQSVAEGARREICDGGYVSLSYCWGGDQPVKLTKTSLKQLKGGIDIRHLPKTLTDAVTITDALGLSYIWIDALCIFQDDALDKGTEIGRLPLYYSRNTLTLSAASADRCTTGILDEDLKVTMRGRGPFGLRFSTAAGECRIQLFEDRLTPSEPILQRAWTLQESALSRRVLAFASDEVKWYCLTGYAVCSDGPASLDSGSSTYIRLVDTSLGPDHNLTLSEWDGVVTRFMSRRLTVESDKLLAVSALASRIYERGIGENAGLVYAAGLFVVPSNEFSWIGPLLWIPNCVTARRSSVYRAPSWSWACLDTDVAISNLGPLIPYKGSGYKYNQCFEILGHQIDLSIPSAPFGGVKAAKIHIDCMMRVLSGKQDFEVTFIESSLPLNLHLTMQPRPSRNELYLLPDTSDDKESMQKAMEGGERVYLMGLLPSWLNASRCWPAIGLALREAPDAGADNFRRIGIFAFYGTCNDAGLAALEAFYTIDGAVFLV